MLQATSSRQLSSAGVTMVPGAHKIVCYPILMALKSDRGIVNTSTMPLTSRVQSLPLAWFGVTAMGAALS